VKGVTSHQVEVLKLTLGSSTPLDFDQILPELTWEPSKEAAQFTIRALVKKGLLAKLPLQLRRGRIRVSYQVTEKGALVLDPRGPLPGSEDLSELLEKEAEEMPSLA
jgi:predicted transcriptional regulator